MRHDYAPRLSEGSPRPASALLLFFPPTGRAYALCVPTLHPPQRSTKPCDPSLEPCNGILTPYWALPSPRLPLRRPTSASRIRIQILSFVPRLRALSSHPAPRLHLRFPASSIRLHTRCSASAPRLSTPRRASPSKPASAPHLHACAVCPASVPWDSSVGGTLLFSGPRLFFFMIRIWFGLLLLVSHMLRAPHLICATHLLRVS